MADAPEPTADAAHSRLRVMILGSGERANVVAEAARLRPLIEAQAEVVLCDLQGADDLSAVEAEANIAKASYFPHHFWPSNWASRWTTLG